MNQAAILVSLTLGLALIYAMYIKGGPRSPLLLVAGFFAFFGFGPAVNILLGNPVYEGTVPQSITGVMLIFALFLSGLAVAQFLPISHGAGGPSPPRKLFDYPVLAPMYAVLMAYSGAVLLLHLPTLLTGSKSMQLAAVGDGHYLYLLIQLAVVPTGLLLELREGLTWLLWRVNAVSYLFYCTLTSERDFLIVFLAFMVLSEYSVAVRKWRLLIAGLVCVLVGAGLFALRSGDGLSLVSLLNQGSILFVDSRIVDMYPDRSPFEHGETYLESLRHILPILEPHGPTLSRWFARDYTGGQNAAYGFSFTAEAFMNFGPAGVFVESLILALGVRLVERGSLLSPLRRWLTCYLVIVWMYALRGDSTQLLRSIEFGAVFLVVLGVTRVAGVESDDRKALGASDNGNAT